MDRIAATAGGDDGMLKLLDLFSGAGGCARGYQMAGFYVTGVDLAPQPRYAGDAFIRGDAFEYVRGHGHEYDAVVASPPCQRYSPLRHRTGRSYPDLIPETRRALLATGRPYVIENVAGAPLSDPLVLCGQMFGLRLYRHRHFECRGFRPAQPPHPRHTVRTNRRNGLPTPDTYVCVVGDMGRRALFEAAMDAMQIDWMTRDELSQAIPPAYTKYVGLQLADHIAYAKKETA